MAEVAAPLILTEASTVAVFGAAVETAPGIISAEPFVTRHDVHIQFAATTLGLEEGGDGTWRVTGNTVARLCEAAGRPCAATECGLRQLAMGNDQRRDRNCAAANTEPVFGGRPGFI